MIKKLLVSLSLVSFLACTAQQKTEIKAGGQALIDCAKADLWQIVKDDGMTLLAKVAAILFSGSSSWKSDLGALAAQTGSQAGSQALGDAVDCAVRAVQVATTATPSNTAATAMSPVAAKAAEWLSGKKFK
jgi:hypothetical protein